MVTTRRTYALDPVAHRADIHVAGKAEFVVDAHHAGGVPGCRLDPRADVGIARKAAKVDVAGNREDAHGRRRIRRGTADRRRNARGDIIVGGGFVDDAKLVDHDRARAWRRQCSWRRLACSRTRSRCRAGTRAHRFDRRARRHPVLVQMLQAIAPTSGVPSGSYTRMSGGHDAVLNATSRSRFAGCFDDDRRAGRHHGRAVFAELLVHTEVPDGHDSGEKCSRTCSRQACASMVARRHGLRHLINRIDDEARLAVRDELRRAAAAERDDRCAASHRFRHHQPERLLPGERHQHARARSGTARASARRPPRRGTRSGRHR